MNYLHNMSNNDPFCYSFRECASFDFSYMPSALKNTETYTIDIIKQLRMIHDSQLVNKKWFWQKIAKPKFGDHILSIDKEGFLKIDDRPIRFDHQFLAWVIGNYNFNLYHKYKVVFDLANKLFQEMYDDIKYNYQQYCDLDLNKEGYSIEKYNTFFLTLKTGLYFTSSECKPYINQDLYKFKFQGHYNETYLLAESIINQELGTNFDYAHKKYGQEYNDRLSNICFETAKIIVDNLPRRIN